MAIKDWTKTMDGESLVRWKKNGQEIEVNRRDTDINPKHNRPIWILIINEDWKNARSFKTKSKATNFAKAYMRKN